ncbi:MAG: Ig-like domain-containing protein [Oscillospiraceae bacterium]
MCKRFSKHARTFLSLFLALIMTLSLAVVPSAAAKAAISKKSVSLVKGQSVTLSVTGTNDKVTWTSANSSVASVSKSGKVTGKGVGTTTVSAKVGSSTFKCKVTVKAGSIKTGKSSVSVNVKKSASVSVSTVGNIELAVSSSDKSVAAPSLKKGSKKGSYTLTVKGVSNGSAKIKVYAKGYEKSIYKYVNVTVGGKNTGSSSVSSKKVTVSVDSVTVNENTSETIKLSAEGVKLKNLSIVSAATHFFEVKTQIDDAANTATVIVNGLAEGKGSLRIFDSSETINVFVPVTVTNNAYDVVVWNREPKRQQDSDAIYVLTDKEKSKKYYVLEPKFHDVAHVNTLLAEASGIYVEYNVYENQPDGVGYARKKEKYNGQDVYRYVAIEKSSDEAYINSAFAKYFNVYEYYTVYATKPLSRNYGDYTVEYDYTTPDRTVEKRYILTQGKDYIGRADDVMQDYIEDNKERRM